MTGPIGPVVVVGASLAGLHAAEALLESPEVSSVTVVGAESAAPYDRPPLSKQLLLGQWEPAQCTLPTLDDPRLTWRTGVAATRLDLDGPRVTLADGLTLDASGGVVIATGGTPRTLPGSDLPGSHVLRTLADAVALRDDIARPGGLRVVVVGGGFIGAEVANACIEQGHEVTMLEVQSAPFERVLGRQVGAAVMAPLLARGVRLVTCAAATRLAGTDRVESVVLRDGSSVSADVVVLGLGIVPETSWLDGSGLVLDNGVECDATLAAGDRVVAAGDVARWPNGRFGELRRVEHWDNAVRQGRHAGQRLLAHHGCAEVRDFVTVPWVWSDLGEHKIQMVGSAVGFDEVVVAHGSTGDARFVALYRRGEELTAVFGMNQPKLVTRYRRRLTRPVAWSEVMAELADTAPAATVAVS
ncbi:FAD/NAD(P)-binding oxidoreductase [Streptomyces sp. NPDC093544]|uniref:NAD(P)/FAD-dependent oxidoreductase n=1 Tax=Streptomyces sp. NPDC093544 TaxID=3155200 RepID=UPI0034180D81